LEEIRTAAQRSADLTRQLLAFARKQTVAPKVLDLNKAIEGMLKMLRRIMGEDITIALERGIPLWEVRMDPSQTDQILANLCVNARDAITGVGKVVIETGNRILSQEYCLEHPDCVPGDYVQFSVTDNGCGMDKELISRIFEPFFTTKGMGRGTGLGLASVYGAVKQNRGTIEVFSEPGKGTTITIILPRHTGEEDAVSEHCQTKTVKHGNETVLLVEDDAAVLKLTTKMLGTLGYTVLSADSPEQVLDLTKQHGHEIQLFLTDVIMPQVNGRDLADSLLARCPHVKVLYMSGYTADVIAPYGILNDGVHFIQKPFTMDSMAAKIRSVLDS
jgi:CheY-like chemotaxis protein